MSENNRIDIGFTVDSRQLQEFTKAIKTIEEFNNKQRTLVDSINRTGNAMNGVSDKAKKATQSQIDMSKAMGQLDNALRNSVGNVSRYEQAQKKLSSELQRYGRNVKVTIDDTGKVRASFVSLEGQTVSLSAKFNEVSGSLSNVKRSFTTTSNEANKLQQSLNGVSKAQRELLNDMVKGRQYMETNKTTTNSLADSYNKLHRGIDLSGVLQRNKGAFDVFNHAVRENSTVVRASIDRNGKWSQTLRDQAGQLMTISGYYDRANQRLTQYSQSMSVATSNSQRLTSAQAAMQQRMNQISNAHTRLNKQTLSWADALEIASVRMLQWTFVATAIFQVRNAFYGVMGVILEVDTQMTNLRRVMDVSDVAEEADKVFGNLFNGAISLAAELGQTIDGTLKAMVGFARQGFGEDMVLELTKVTTIMSAVSSLDMETAMSKLTSGMVIFKNEVNDAMQVVDMLNEVDNNFAVTTEDLALSMSKAGGTANAFGISLDKVLGYTTAIGEATRESGNIIGNSIKSWGSRITTLGSASDALNDVGVATTHMNDGFREVRRVDDILDDLALKWDDLTASEQQNIGVKVAGRFQLSRFLTLMQNYDRGLEASEAALNSHGSAQREFDEYLKSMQANMNLMIGAAQRLALTIGEKGLGTAMVTTLKSVTAMLAGVDSLVEKFGAWNLLIPLILAATTALSLNYKKLILDKTLLMSGTVGVNAQLTAMAVRMGMSTTAATALSGATMMLVGSLRAIAVATVANPFFWVTAALVAIPMLIGYTRNQRAEQERLAESAKEADKAYKELKGRVRNNTFTEYDLSGLERQLDGFKEHQKSLKEVEEQINNIGFSLRTLSDTNIDNYVGQWTQFANKDLLEHAHNVGIVVGEYENFGEFMEAYNSRMKSMEGTYDKATKSMEKQGEQVNKNAQAFQDMNEEIEETFNLMRTLLGLEDTHVKSLKEQAHFLAIMAEVGQEAWTDGQMIQYNNSAAQIADTLGMTTDEVMNNTDAVFDKIKAYEKDMKKIDEYIEKGEHEKAAEIIKTRNKEEETRKRIVAENEATAAAEEATKRKEALSNIYQGILESDALVHGESTGKIKSKAEELVENLTSGNKMIMSSSDLLATKYGLTRNSIENSNDGVSRSSKSTTDGVTNNLGIQRTNLITASGSWNSYGVKAKESNSTATTSTSSAKDSIVTHLSTISSSILGVRDNWGILSSFMTRNPISAAINIGKRFFGIGGPTSATNSGYNAHGNSHIGGTTSITSGYGMRNDPINGRTGFHNGIDIAGNQGSPIRSNVSGQVVYSGVGRSGTSLQGLGNVVGIQDAMGLTHLYGHNSSNFVQEGAYVSAGQTIASMGNTGRSTGTHSHYEVRAGGRSINPMAAMGGSYTVKRGDTFSGIATKYYGNAYNGGMAALQKLNPSIKDINKIQVGQTLKIPSASNSSPTAPAASTSTPKKTMTKEEADKLSRNTMNYMSYIQGMGLQNDSTYQTWKLRDHYDRFANGSTDTHRQYNRLYADGLKGYDDLSKAKTAFDQAGWLSMDQRYQDKLWKEVEESVKSNAMEKLDNSTKTWLDNFNKGLKGANEKTVSWLNLAESMQERQESMMRDRYINDMTDSLNVWYGFEEPLSQMEQAQKRLEEIRREADERINQNVQMQYEHDPVNVANRLKELDDYRKTIQNRINSTINSGSKNNLSAKDLEGVLEPLRNQLSNITDEYNELNKASKEADRIFYENELSLSDLSDEYKRLQKELDDTAKKTETLDKIKSKVNSIFEWNASSLINEKTDEFGNSVRDVEGTIRAVLDVQKAIEEITSDIYGNIDKAVSEMITELIGSQMPSISDLFDNNGDYEGITNSLNGAIDSIKPTWDANLEYMAGSINNMFTSQDWNKVVGEWTYNMGQAMDNLSPIFENLLVKFPESIGKVMEDLPNLVSVAMQNITVGLFNTVIQIMNQLVGTVNQIVPSVDRIPAFEKMQYSTPTYTQNNENTSNNENKVYKADTNVTRNVTYVVQAGVVVGTESEMREFAMIIKELIDEEKERGNS